MDGKLWRRLGVIFGPFLVFAGLLAGCDGGGCQLHSDCPRGERCVAGACALACSDDYDCVLGEACQGGACVAAADSARPRPCDPSASEAGCPDTSSPPDAAADISIADARPADAATDMLADAAPDVGDARADQGADAADSAPGDGGGPDGSVTPGDIDLTGTYAVTRTVDLTNDDRFSEGDIAHFIANLTRLDARARYRMDFIDPEGHALSSEVAVDFRSPEGPFNYQFRYERPIDPPPPGCQAFEETFERGEVHLPEPATEAEITLDGQQILHGQYEGDACAEADRLTNFTVRWVRIPVPVPTGDAGPPTGDALPVPADGGGGDAAVPAGDAGPVLNDAAVPVVRDAVVPGASDAVPPGVVTPDAGAR